MIRNKIIFILLCLCIIINSYLLYTNHEPYTNCNYIPYNLGNNIDNVITKINNPLITPNNYLLINKSFIKNNTPRINNKINIKNYKKIPNFIKNLKENKILVNPYINRPHFITDMTILEEQIKLKAYNDFIEKNSLDTTNITSEEELNYKKLALHDYFKNHNIFHNIFEWDTGSITNLKDKDKDKEEKCLF